MKSKYNISTKLCKAWIVDRLKIKSMLSSVLILTGFSSSIVAQEIQEVQAKPSWWFGVAAGANFNFFRGSTQELNDDITPPLAFHDGFGIGLNLAPTIEYYKPNTLLGMMLQFGYESRKGNFNQITTTCNCPADLSANVSYFTFEPSLRIAPFKNNFFLFVGPRFAYNYNKSFVYQLGINPDYPEQTPSPEVSGDFSNMNQLLVSMQAGLGTDIPLSSQAKRTQLVLAPFISFHPYFGQNPRSIETWNVTTLRVGAALKIGAAKKVSKELIEEEEELEIIVEEVRVEEVAPEITALDVEFIVNSPENIPAKRKVRETFPLRNYVFFDLGSTEIPKRYVALNKSEVADFKEDQVEFKTPENLSGRSKRQMIVYYNILNILGDRMQKNPSATIKLVGSSEGNKSDALEMAESIKTYLVDVFEIKASRIATEGRNKPNVPSRHSEQAVDLVMLKEGERRVSIETNSPALLMEFQSGPNAPLKPVDVLVIEEAPIDSYVTFENKNAIENFTSWHLEITDQNGTVQNYGPFTGDKVSIPGKDILGTTADGKYNVKMIGTTLEGKIIEKESKVNMVLWVPSETAVAMRFSVIYEFDESKASNIYDKYLHEIVVPKIPKNGKVIIHGHTDNIGNVSYNEKLSMKRANDVKDIMKSALSKHGRTDVTFEVLGLGEDSNLSPFENKYPEERFYNRTVIIDILPQK
jgi:outer membrane protein OmpA-like peptidoglycan-associated protein